MTRGIPYKRYTSLRKFKKANHIRHVPAEVVWDEIKAQREFNRRLTTEFGYDIDAMNRNDMEEMCWGQRS